MRICTAATAALGGDLLPEMANAIVDGGWPVVVEISTDEEWMIWSSAGPLAEYLRGVLAGRILRLDVAAMAAAAAQEWTFGDLDDPLPLLEGTALRSLIIYLVM